MLPEEVVITMGENHQVNVVLPSGLVDPRPCVRVSDALRRPPSYAPALPPGRLRRQWSRSPRRVHQAGPLPVIRREPPAPDGTSGRVNGHTDALPCGWRQVRSLSSAYRVAALRLRTPILW